MRDVRSPGSTNRAPENESFINKWQKLGVNVVERTLRYGVIELLRIVHPRLDRAHVVAVLDLALISIEGVS